MTTCFFKFFNRKWSVSFETQNKHIFVFHLSIYRKFPPNIIKRCYNNFSEYICTFQLEKKQVEFKILIMAHRCQICNEKILQKKIPQSVSRIEEIAYIFLRIQNFREIFKIKKPTQFGPDPVLSFRPGCVQSFVYCVLQTPFSKGDLIHLPKLKLTWLRCSATHSIDTEEVTPNFLSR